MKAKKHLNLRIPLWWPSGPGWRRLARAMTPHPGTLIVTLLVVAGLLWANSVGALPLRAPAAAGTSTGTIAYQGRLADADGTPITDTVNMEFRLYDVASGGIFLWEELWTGSNSVEVSDGLFNVMLGSLDPIPQSVITEHDSLFLGITVGTDDEMTPRVQLGTVPFAVQALTVPDGSMTTEKIADEAVTQAKLGADVSLEPADGSVTTAKIADGAVTSAKLEHPGPHIPITPDENGLVNMAFLRQDDTTDSDPTSLEDCGVASNLVATTAFISNTGFKAVFKVLNEANMPPNRPCG